MMRKLIGACLAIGLCFAFAITSYAENEITSLSVSMSEMYAEPGEVHEVELRTNSNVIVEELEVSKPHSSWRPGEKITFNAVLVPEEGYGFRKSKIKNISISNGKLVNQSVSSRKVVLKINYTPKVRLQKPENIYFEDEYKASWDKVRYCSMYEAQIFKESDDGNYETYRTERISGTKIDLSAYITDGSAAYFKIRAVPKNSSESAYLFSSDWSDSNDVSSSNDNTIQGNFSGSGKDMIFRDLKGGEVSGWQKINGNWYYFNPENQNKAVSADWGLVNGKWYYFNDYGIMMTGWKKINDLWYYLDSDGAMRTGWFRPGPSSGWYYLDVNTGAMWASATTPDGYTVDASGVWIN